MTDQAGVTLVIAEKPSVARDLARVLGCRERLDGAISGKGYIVSWAIGHLISLAEPDELDEKYKKWREADLPILPETLPTKVLPKTKSQFQILKKYLLEPQVHDVVCATDAGREGELIFRYIYQQAKASKPVKRLWISSMTDQAIREGFARLRPSSEYDALYASARCRAEADWLVGMNATRAFTLRFHALLSVGRVQTPTLKLIVDRDRAIRDFKPEEYYELRVDFGDYAGMWIDPEKKESRIPTQAQAEALRAKVQKKTGVVSDVRRENKSTPPPQLYDLTSLQREANQLLGLSAAKTLSIAQSLYEKHKLITYPRTDSRCLSRDMIPRVQKTLSAMPAPYQAFAQAILPTPPVKARVYNDNKVTDHHAIVPTGQFANMQKLSDMEARVFDMIAKRLIAAHYPDYEYESTVILTQIEGETFKTAGTTPIRPGWKALYPNDKADKPETELPRVAPGDTRVAQKTTVKKCQTKPPVPHTDASLLYMMEHAGNLMEDEALKERMKQSGLGTPATRAAIIERLLQVGYIARRGKTLCATEKGEKLIAVAPEAIESPEMTGKWERALNTMAQESDAEKRARLETRFMDSIRRYAAFLVDAARQSETDVAFEREEYARGGKKRGKTAPKVSPLGRKCPVCGEGEIQANARAFGCSRWREGCKFTVWRDQFARQSGPSITVNIMKNLLDGKEVPCEGGVLVLQQGRVILKKS